MALAEALLVYRVGIQPVKVCQCRKVLPVAVSMGENSCTHVKEQCTDPEFEHNIVKEVCTALWVCFFPALSAVGEPRAQDKEETQPLPTV